MHPNSANKYLEFLAICGPMPEVCFNIFGDKEDYVAKYKQAKIRKKYIEPLTKAGLIKRTELDPHLNPFTKACRRYYSITHKGREFIGIDDIKHEEFSSSSWKHEVALRDVVSGYYKYFYLQKGWGISVHYNFSLLLKTGKYYNPDCLINLVSPSREVYSLIIEVELKKNVDVGKFAKIDQLSPKNLIPFKVNSFKSERHPILPTLDPRTKIVFYIADYRSNPFTRTPDIKADQIGKDDKQTLAYVEKSKTIKSDIKNNILFTALCYSSIVNGNVYFDIKGNVRKLINKI